MKLHPVSPYFRITETCLKTYAVLSSGTLTFTYQA